MVVYGVTKDGTLTKCRAKPQNRGKGNCPHKDHIELNVAQQEIDSLNEKILAEKYKNDKAIKNLTKNNTIIESSWGGTSLTREQFNESVNKVSQQFKDEDYSFIQKFYEKFDSRFKDATLKKKFRNASTNIYDFLTSDDPVAIQTRSFLGKDVDLQTFSEILTKNVSSMTESIHWKNNGKSPRISRVLLSHVSNDMTKERYVASVMFFGGRCCYCKKVLTRDGSKNAASGEHITPISPTSPPPGATRFGNMVLACIECNKKRGNQQLEQWLKTTTDYTTEEKRDIQLRIQKFRNYALYSDYSQEQYNEIKKSVNMIRDIMRKLPRDEHHKYSEDNAEKIRYVIMSEREHLHSVLK